ncbi:MAG TPA: polyhydroxyalkanoic acid system family protein [Polyangiaceae bacterium]|nr:polyhydroxyalkanoic acid system family protein [Polyangiaceae bacterium]
MTTFEIRFSHGFGPDELRERAERFARSAEERYKTSWRWEGDTLHLANASNSPYAASAAMVVGPGEVRLSVDMPAALLPVRSTLEQDLRWAIERTFDVSLPPDAPA